MTFIEPRLDVFLEKLSQLTADKQPEWGTMSATRMVEHLSDSLDLSTGVIQGKLQIPEDKVEGALNFLFSEKPMPRGFKANYAPAEQTTRHDNIELAIDELSLKWIEFETHFLENESPKTVHPVYGSLDYESWLTVHSKHFTHHFEQFGI